MLFKFKPNYIYIFTCPFLEHANEMNGSSAVEQYCVQLPFVTVKLVQKNFPVDSALSHYGSISRFPLATGISTFRYQSLGKQM